MIILEDLVCGGVALYCIIQGGVSGLTDIDGVNKIVETPVCIT